MSANAQCYHGWVIAGEVQQTIVGGQGPGHGHPDLLNSYRSKLCGLLALYYIVYRVCEYHGIAQGTMRVHEQGLLSRHTPTELVEAFLHGFRDWLDPSFAQLQCSRPPSFGSLFPVKVLITQAYAELFHTIGWFQLCLGRISRKLHEVHKACLPPARPYDSVCWGAQLISHHWKFTRGMWHHHNALVHGADAEASAQRILSTLRNEVRQHYSAFETMEGYVLARHRYLFTTRTLDQRSKLSYDYVNCWLRSVRLARQLLEAHVASLRATSARFFGPFQPHASEQDTDESYHPSRSDMAESDTTTLATSSITSSTDSESDSLLTSQSIGSTDGSPKYIDGYTSSPDELSLLSSSV
jgi:hypothetical protein